MLLQNESVMSSFGPHGRSKVLYGTGGSIIVTKDCQQLIGSSLTTNILTNTLIRMCTTHADIYGDGTMSLILMLDSLLKNCVVTCGSSGSSIHYRRHMLDSLSVLIRAIHMARERIDRFLLQSGVCRHVNRLQDAVESVCLQILTPAASVDVAEKLTYVIMKWLEASKWGCMNPTTQLEFIEYAVSNFDNLVLSSAAGCLGESYVVPASHIFLEGRCRDSFRISSGHRLPFVCMSSLLAANGDDDITPVLSVPSLTSLSSGMNIGLSGAAEALYIIRDVFSKGGVVVVFCGEAAGDALLLLAGQLSITIVDCIPEAQLQLLCNRSSISLYASPRDLKDHLLSVKNSVVELDRGLRFGRLMGLEQVRLGKGDTMLRVTGITSCSDNVTSMSNLPGQIVLRGSGSAAVSGMYRRLLVRCLRGISSCCRPYCTGDAEAGVFAVGGGMIELACVSLWGAIGEHVAEHVPAVARGDFVYRKLEARKGLLFDIAASIGNDMLDSICRGHSNLYSTALLSSLNELCHSVSMAYSAVPSLLMKNRHAPQKLNSKSSNSLGSDVRYLSVQHTFANVLDRKDEDTTDGSELGVLQWAERNHFLSQREGIQCKLPLFPITAFYDRIFIALEALRLYVRIGGEAGVLVGKRKTNT